MDCATSECGTGVVWKCWIEGVLCRTVASGNVSWGLLWRVEG